MQQLGTLQIVLSSSLNSLQMGTVPSQAQVENPGHQQRHVITPNSNITIHIQNDAQSGNIQGQRVAVPMFTLNPRNNQQQQQPNTTTTTSTTPANTTSTTTTPPQQQPNTTTTTTSSTDTTQPTTTPNTTGTAPQQPVNPLQNLFAMVPTPTSLFLTFSSINLDHLHLLLPLPPLLNNLPILSLK